MKIKTLQSSVRKHLHLPATLPLPPSRKSSHYKDDRRREENSRCVRFQHKYNSNSKYDLPDELKKDMAEESDNEKRKKKDQHGRSLPPNRGDERRRSTSAPRVSEPSQTSHPPTHTSASVYQPLIRTTASSTNTPTVNSVTGNISTPAWGGASSGGASRSAKKQPLYTWRKNSSPPGVHLTLQVMTIDLITDLAEEGEVEAEEGEVEAGEMETTQEGGAPPLEAHPVAHPLTLPVTPPVTH